MGPLCDIGRSIPMPARFSDSILKEYESSNAPNYLSNVANTPTIRSFYPTERAKAQEILTQLPIGVKTSNYDAWEEDIAVVKVYFAKESSSEFKRYPSLTWIGFFSQMGGLLGLC